MPSEPLAGYPSVDRAIRGYIHRELDERALSLTPPRIIEVERSFIRFLTERGVLELSAYEIYERHSANILRQAGNAVEAWEEIGEHRPFAPLMEQPEVLASWRNPLFYDLTGCTPIPEDLASAYEWIRRNAGAAFLLPALCYLRAIGCDRVFLTDGPGDEGIDCIGRLGGGHMRGTAVFVQAKSSADFLSGEQFAAMQTRYAGLPSTPMFRRYLDALEVPRSKEGASFVFLVAAQGRFKDAAKAQAWKSGVLLRSGRAVALALSGYYPHGALDALLARPLQLPAGVDLTRNLAADLAWG